MGQIVRDSSTPVGMTESFHQGDVLISSAASLILRIASRFEVEDFVKQLPGWNPSAESGSPRDESVRLADGMPNFRCSDALPHANYFQFPAFRLQTQLTARCINVVTFLAT